MEDIMALGDTIRKFRKAKNLTLQDVGASLGLTYQAVQKWEKNKSEPNTGQLIELATLFEIPLEELINDELIVGNIKGILPFNAKLIFHLPFISVNDRNALVNGFTNNESVKSLSASFTVTASNIPLNETHVVIEIDGDVMEPRLLNSTKVLAEFIAPENFSHEVGGIYAVLYGKKFAVRRIINNDIEEHGKLFLQADNSKYLPIPVDAKSIRAMWKVLRIVDAPID